jgi:hypothetical protein
MKNLFFIVLIVLFYGCKDTVKKQDSSVLNTTKGVAIKHVKTVALEETSKENTSDWKEYQSVSKQLQLFSTISANEALSNALELAKLVKQLKDSIRPLELINPAFRTRVNVLENDVLLLKEMTYISALNSKEINTQVGKILAAFSATNSKINTVYSQLAVEKRIEQNLIKAKQ